MTNTQAARKPGRACGGRSWDGMVDTENSVSGTTHRAVVEAAHAGWRLDRFLVAALPQFSRARLQQLIVEGAVTLPLADQQSRKIGDANHRVKLDEIYAVAVPPARPTRPQGQDIPLIVVYEDKDLIVIDKPAGLVVHPAAGNPDGTLVNALIAHCGEGLIGIGGEARPGIVHRLDKDTSGLLVAAKNERAMTSLAKQFANHTIERAYHAMVWGSPRATSGTIESQIGRSGFDRKRMAVLRTGGKLARTGYRVLEKFGPAERPFASLIECRLETGRTHQIRVHLTHLGHPLIGDPQYGRTRAAPRAKTQAEEEAFGAATDFSRQALHAFVLGFQHPSQHKALRFESPWPADFARLAAALQGLNAG
jgi:23S rRNA pseudouridine1911/1915/1917 synthase